jgi:hypothetical protein
VLVSGTMIVHAANNSWSELLTSSLLSKARSSEFHYAT